MADPAPVRCACRGSYKKELADALFHTVPAGLGSTGRLHLDAGQMDAMLRGGAAWAVERGYGTAEDLERIEEHGCMAGARPEEVSEQAKHRQRNEVGTLGSGNHYLEVQHVAEILDLATATAFAIRPGDVLVSIHCGSRGLGHQVGTDVLRRMALAAADYDIELPDRELACAPMNSPIGRAYLAAMRAAINFALANRQVITHLARQAFAEVIPGVELPLLYDVSHNTCKLEEHVVRRPIPAPFRAPQGGHPGVRPRPPGPAGIAAQRRPAGADRWLDGHGFIHPGRHPQEHGACLRVILPRGRPRHEPTRGAQALARARGDR